MSNGLILGYIEGKTSKWRGIMSVFDRDVDDKIACQRFLRAFQRKQPPHLLRLTEAIHTMIVAPAGAGKSTGAAIPFLKTCRESAVVVDFKGELSRSAKVIS